MIKDMNMNGQHKRILFMISLPQTAEFETCNENVSECINKLREKRVDVCESIHREDLATLNQYDIVIIVAHHDTYDDALLLADGKLSMDDFVNSIPEDFRGELDFSSCYSASAMKAIKLRCPNCHIQASIHQTTLALRLLAYPFVIDIINEDNSIEYHDAYMKVLDMMLEAASESSESEEEQPEHVKLGNQLSSVYAPSEVKRASKFMIQLILHYDSESGTILAIAKGHEPDTCWRGTLLNNLCEGDSFSIKIKFDSDNIFVVDDDNVRHNEYIKQITVGKDVLEEQFMVEVVSDYSGSSFWTIISLLKENNWVPGFKFKIMVSDHENKIPADVVMEIPPQSENPEDIINCYADVFTGRIFDYSSSSGNYSNFQQILSKKNTHPDKLHFIRRFIYNNDLFLNQLKKFVDSSNNELSNLLKEDSKDKTIITWEIVPLLKGCIIKIQEKLDSLETKFKSVKIKARGNVNFDEAIPKIPSLESKFIDLASEIKYIDFQIQMLKIYKELRDNLSKYSKEDIKESASDFWEYPHKHLVDQGLFDILRNKCNPGSIKSSKSGGHKGVSMSYLALLLAMVCGEYISIDNGREGWFINVADYIDLSNYKEESLRTPKSRINDFVSVLRDKDVRESINRYMKTKAGKMSISAVLLLNIKV